MRNPKDSLSAVSDFVSITAPDKRTERTSVTAQAFSPKNAMIEVGIFQLNKLSDYLNDHLPDSAKATLLIAPKTTPSIVKGTIDTWKRHVKGISRINEEHGLHYNEQFLSGMALYRFVKKLTDHPRKRELHYEWFKKQNRCKKEWAGQITEDWEMAKASGRPILTQLALPSQIITGIILRNKERINRQIGIQDGDPIVGWMYSSQKDTTSTVNKRNITNKGTSYPIALHIHPPEPEV